MKINKYVLGVLSLLILIIGIAVGTLLVEQNQDIREKAAPATVAYISPTTQDAQIGKDFSFYIKMDSSTNLISGADIRIKFDPNIFQVVSLEKGQGVSNFDSVLSSTFDNNAGTVKYILYTLDKSKSVSGSGIDVLRVNAKSKSNAPVGIYTLSFDTGTAASGLTETQNILTTLTPGSISLKTTVAQNQTEGEPNSCGGTCGSNFNCKANLYCYKGFCRSPMCSDKADCNCSTTTAVTTPKSTTKAQGTTKPLSKGEGGIATSGSPKATPTYVSGIPKLDSDADSLTREEEDSLPKNMFWSKYALYIVGFFSLIAIALVISAMKKNRNDDTPHILPPTNI